ncbi:hypothetical protein JRI60_28335 [Archangium violaceum]|uniref:Kelch repeat-containing protein n=1 Tax=Archangium violaceum TaxID=83451 RepID=UPI00195123BA|nr:kelch repeat-containing protein [Archangium violaceum]QRN93113.1 hypothetical protein JRI60_28335 [Archangium violaceum]
MSEILQDAGGTTSRPDAIIEGEHAHAHVIPATDDGSSGPIEVGFPVNFFGKFYTHLFINTNGNVTFGEPLYKYIPAGLKVKSGLPPIIAPFLADVDTRARDSGRIGYGTVMFESRVALCVNWISVGYHRERTDKLNSFQLLLVDRGDAGLGDFDIVMNYDRLEWESGGSTRGTGGLGGRTAAAGLSAGTGKENTFFEFPGSHIPGALLDTHADGLSNTSTNSAVKGRHIFRMRRGMLNVPTKLRDGAHLMPRAVRLLDGRVLVLGEFNRVADVFDPRTNTWTSTKSTNANRRRHTATLLPNGHVLVTGGEDQPKTAEVYDPATNDWTAVADMSVGRVGHTATLLESGKVLVIGGQATQSDSSERHASAELYDPELKTWTVIAHAMNSPRSWHTATLLPDGNVLVTGGENFDLTTRQTFNLASVELYDAKNGTWTLAGGMSTARRAHTATLLKTGQVLVVGGKNATSTASYGSAELYDLEDKVWKATGSLALQRCNHTATLLDSGHVLVTGGYHAGSDLGGIRNSVELYDPETQTWSTTVPMGADREFHDVALLTDGRLLIVGGSSNIGKGTYEFYYHPLIRRQEPHRGGCCS